jgi:hypothetical protein
MNSPGSNLPASVSFNYSIFKVVSILMVVTSHWFSKYPLWLPTTIGLFIFAFSSAFFTARIYGSKLDVAAFWRRKLQRLLIRYWFLLFCIAVLMFFRGGTVLHWHSLVHVFGLSGFLNLFGTNQSALGMGLWFFTLLLLFYVSYPYLARVCTRSGNDFFLPLVMTLAMTFLDTNTSVGFALWLTALGFMLGVYIGVVDTRVAPRFSGPVALASLLLVVGLNFVFKYNEANHVLLAIACISINLWLLKMPLPQWKILQVFTRLENCLLEIFIIHTYLFMHPTGQQGVDFLISLAVIIVAGWVLNILGSKLVELVFGDRAAKSLVQKRV